MEEAMKEVLAFLDSTPADVARITLTQLPLEQQSAIYYGFEGLAKERPLSGEEKSAMIVVGEGAVEYAKQVLASFQAEHGVNVALPPPPPMINDPWNIRAELEGIKAEVEAKQANNPPDIGDGGNHNGDGPNGGDNNAGDFNGPDDDHKEGEVIEGEHGR